MRKFIVLLFALASAISAKPSEIQASRMDCKQGLCKFTLVFATKDFNPTIQQKLDPKTNELKLTLGRVFVKGQPKQSGVIGKTLTSLNLKSSTESVDFHFRFAQPVSSGFKKIRKQGEFELVFELPQIQGNHSEGLSLAWDKNQVPQEQTPPETKEPKPSKEPSKAQAWDAKIEESAWKQFKQIEKQSNPQIKSSFSLKSKPVQLVVPQKAQLFSAPDSKSQLLAEASFGKTATYLRRQAGWYQVQEKEIKGWVPQSQMIFLDELNPEQKKTWDSQNPEQVKTRDQWEKIVSATARPALHKSKGFIYTSYGRRDPFLPIELPEIEGISIDQVRLTGIIWSQKDPIAILEDVRDPNVSYSLRQGDAVVNGKVVKITPKEVVFSVTDFGVTRRFAMVLPEIQDNK
jgi:hypothetical protein